jgi:hypothetical protein
VFLELHNSPRENLKPNGKTMFVGVYEINIFTNSADTWMYVRVRERDKPERWFALG